MEAFIGFLLILFFGFVILVNIGALKNVGNRKDPARQAMKNEQALNQQFFDGTDEVTFKTPGNWLPPSAVIRAAPQHGYELVEHEDEGYGRETLTFQKMV